MDISRETEFNLTNLSKINILLGKNGSGKSTLLKNVEKKLKKDNTGEVNYITPERGGTLKFNAMVSQNSSDNEDWLLNQKRKNQWNDYKSYSITLFQKLEMLSLREMEKDKSLRLDLKYSFDTIISKINSLLTNIKLKRTQKNIFDIVLKGNNTEIKPDGISSGEGEVIALAIECLTFAKTCETGKKNILFMDEPDVHLHPDLQAKFIEFLIDLVSGHDFSIIIATHSTAILGALVNYQYARFAVLENKSTNVNFKEISNTYKTILPIFGAHPLSNLFNQSPVFLVEGDDDVRIFQQAIRTSQGKLKLYPCQTGSIDNLNEYENAVIEVINGVYDNAQAYSLRDGDGVQDEITDKPPIVRFRLSCRNAESLMLSDEVLKNIGTSWSEMQTGIENWLLHNEHHSKFDIMKEFQKSNYDRKNFDIKQIRNVLLGISPTSKPWEVAIGQIIGKINIGQIPKDFGTNKICNYMGTKLSGIF